MRKDPQYEKYLVYGGLLDARNAAAHERRARRWNEAQFTQYFQSLQSQCEQLSKALYGARSSSHAKTIAQCARCGQSITDSELESLVFKLACRMVSTL